MRIKLKPKKKVMSKELIEESAESPSLDYLNPSAEAFGKATDSMTEVLVERVDEIQALKICLVAGEHLMLEGPSGIAKSKLVDCLISRMTGVKAYQKQFTSTTQPDEILGCMNSKKYREEAVWEYNVEGMLPDCHIAFLDEVYRGPKSLLSNLFEILNERRFKVGKQVTPCPLITAVGTTNFTTLDEELDAFHDRWLVRAKVAPLKTAQSRITMLTRALNPEEVKLSFFTLNNLNVLRSGLKHVVLEDYVLSLYEELVMEVCKQTKVYVSDRRLVQTLRLVLAGYVMDTSRPEKLNENFLSAARYGITTVGDSRQTEIFDECWERVVGARVNSMRFAKKLSALESEVLKMSTAFCPGLDNETLQEWTKRARTISNAFSNTPNLYAELGNSNDNVEKAKSILRKALPLCNTMEELMLKRIKKKMMLNA